MKILIYIQNPTHPIFFLQDMVHRNPGNALLVHLLDADILYMFSQNNL